MTGMPFVILAVVLSLGLQPQPPKKADPTGSQPSPPKKNPVVEVQIIVGSSEKQLSGQCTKNTPATAVFVETSKPVKVYHCISTKLHNHSEHDKNQKLMDPADIKVATGQRIRWVSKVPFYVVDVIKPKDPKHQPQDPLAPLRPFGEFTSKAYVTQVETAAVPDVASEKPVVQRYKVTFNIEKIGLVDPDVVCTM